MGRVGVCVLLYDTSAYFCNAYAPTHTLSPEESSTMFCSNDGSTSLAATRQLLVALPKVRLRSLTTSSTDYFFLDQPCRVLDMNGVARSPKRRR
jgi:hypothetical protein